MNAKAKCWSQSERRSWNVRFMYDAKTQPNFRKNMPRIYDVTRSTYVIIRSLKAISSVRNHNLLRAISNIEFDSIRITVERVNEKSSRNWKSNAYRFSGHSVMHFIYMAAIYCHFTSLRCRKSVFFGVKFAKVYSLTSYPHEKSYNRILRAWNRFFFLLCKW